MQRDKINILQYEMCKEKKKKNKIPRIKGEDTENRKPSKKSI